MQLHAALYTRTICTDYRQSLQVKRKPYACYGLYFKQILLNLQDNSNFHTIAPCGILRAFHRLRLKLLADVRSTFVQAYSDQRLWDWTETIVFFQATAGPVILVSSAQCEKILHWYLNYRLVQILSSLTQELDRCFSVD